MYVFVYNYNSYGHSLVKAGVETDNEGYYSKEKGVQI